MHDIVCNLPVSSERTGNRLPQPTY